jgi:ribosomal protein S8
LALLLDSFCRSFFFLELSCFTLDVDSVHSFLGYIGEFEIIDDHRCGKIVINLFGRLNKTACISPRFDVRIDQFEQWTSHLLPSRQFGYLVLTTSKV